MFLEIQAYKQRKELEHTKPQKRFRNNNSGGLKSPLFLSLGHREKPSGNRSKGSSFLAYISSEGLSSPGVFFFWFSSLEHGCGKKVITSTQDPKEGYCNPKCLSDKVTGLNEAKVWRDVRISFSTPLFSEDCE